jgi:hypothetical protein
MKVGIDICTKLLVSGYLETRSQMPDARNLSKRIVYFVRSDGIDRSRRMARLAGICKDFVVQGTIVRDCTSSNPRCVINLNAVLVENMMRSLCSV